MKKFFRTSLWILLALLAAGTFFFLWQNSRPRHDRRSEEHTSELQSQR